MNNRSALISFLQNQSLLVIITVWMLSGFLLGASSVAVVFATAIFLVLKRRYLELFLGFAFLLFLADSRQDLFIFAKDSRDFYAVLMTGAIIFDKHFPIYRKFYQYFVPFFVIAGVALYFSPTLLMGGLKTISYLLIILIVPNYVMHIYQVYGNRFINQLLSVSVFILGIGIVLSFVYPEFVYLAGRYNGLLGNPNGMGLFVMLIAILFEVHYSLNPGEFTPRGRIIFLAAAFLSVILSGSRTAMMGILIFFVLKNTLRVSKALTVVSVTFAILLAPFLLHYLPIIIRDLGLAEFFRLDSLQSMSGRAIAFEFSWSQIQHNFWLGKGFGYSEYLFDIWQDYLNDLGHQGSTHNTYLTVWLDTGLFGVLCFVGGWGSIFLQASRVSYLAIPVGCTILFGTLFESWLSASLNAFTIILLIIITLLTIPDYAGKTNE